MARKGKHPEAKPIGSMTIEMKEIVPVGDNEHGYAFGVGLVGDHWLGFANTEAGLFVFPEVADGVQTGTARPRRSHPSSRGDRPGS